MNLYFGHETIAEPAWHASAVTIGVFDGVHLGHQALIREAVALARAEGLPAIVITFHAHPAELLRPDQAPEYLCTFTHRLQRFAQLGVDHALVLRFDAQLASLSASEFLETVLVSKLRVRHVVVGDDFRFGRNREGDVEFLRRAGAAYDFQTHLVGPVTDPASGARISSSHIRQRVREGALEEVARLLGEPFTWTGLVVPGDGRGRPLGFPTANLQPVARLILPPDGIYSARAYVDGHWYLGGLSLGFRPTFPEAPAAVEIHLMEFPDRCLYGRTLEVQVLERLRHQQRFENLEALRDQIHQDLQRIREGWQAEP